MARVRVHSSYEGGEGGQSESLPIIHISLLVHTEYLGSVMMLDHA